MRAPPQYCAREAAQIFGGNAYIRGGPGERVERLYREARRRTALGGEGSPTLQSPDRSPISPLTHGGPHCQVRAYAIPGGSEEVLLDLGIKQAMKGAKGKPGISKI